MLGMFFFLRLWELFKLSRKKAESESVYNNEGMQLISGFSFLIVGSIIVIM